jgi:hypothetical protein
MGRRVGSTPASACGVCGSPSLPWTEKSGFRIVRCTACGHGFVLLSGRVATRPRASGESAHCGVDLLLFYAGLLNRRVIPRRVLHILEGLLLEAQM